MIEKTHRANAKLEDEQNLGAAGDEQFSPFTCGSKLLYEIQAEPVFNLPSGNEDDDFRFLNSSRKCFGEQPPVIDDFTKAAIRQKGRFAFKESGLRTYSHGLLQGYEFYKLSDKYEYIRPNGKDDYDIFRVRVVVIQNRKGQVEFTKEFHGDYAHYVFRFLKANYGITEGKRQVCVKFSHRTGKWMLDLSKRPLARFSPNAKPFPL